MNDGQNETQNKVINSFLISASAICPYQTAYIPLSFCITIKIYRVDWCQPLTKWNSCLIDPVQVFEVVSGGYIELSAVIKVAIASLIETYDYLYSDGIRRVVHENGSVGIQTRD